MSSICTYHSFLFKKIVLLKCKFLIGACILLTCCIANKPEYAETITDEKMMAYLSSRHIVASRNNADSVFGIGYYNVYMGKNELGNKIMNYALSLKDSITYEDYHALSVQNTKNGNYPIAINALEKALALNPEVHGYYGWVLLYYYRDYRKALVHLEKYDSLTPNYSDAPGGENIHFLKGLVKMNLKDYNGAIAEFNNNIGEVSDKSGEEWVSIATFLYKGRCYHKLKRFNDAIDAYDKAIKYHDSFTEALFYKGLVLFELGEKNLGCENVKKALDLRNKGHRQSDSYVELFDEIYVGDIEAAINLHCK